MTKTKTEAPVATAPVASAPFAAGSPIKRYEETSRKNAVEYWSKTGPPGTQIAAELGVNHPTLKEWKRRYHGDAMPEHGHLELENRSFRAELARVREQRDSLKNGLIREVYRFPKLHRATPAKWKLESNRLWRYDEDTETILKRESRQVASPSLFQNHSLRRAEEKSRNAAP